MDAGRGETNPPASARPVEFRRIGNGKNTGGTQGGFHEELSPGAAGFTADRSSCGHGAFPGLCRGGGGPGGGSRAGGVRSSGLLWGYYPYYPYDCAPYGYYGPELVRRAACLSAPGPWYHWGWGGRGWGHYGYGYRGGWGDIAAATATTADTGIAAGTAAFVPDTAADTGTEADMAFGPGGGRYGGGGRRGWRIWRRLPWRWWGRVPRRWRRISWRRRWRIPRRRRPPVSLNSNPGNARPASAGGLFCVCEALQSFSAPGWRGDRRSARRPGGGPGCGQRRTWRRARQGSRAGGSGYRAGYFASRGTLGEQSRGPCIHHDFGVAGLVVVGGGGKRNQQRGLSSGGKFGHSRRSTARHHEVGLGEPCRHVVEKRLDLPARRDRLRSLRRPPGWLRHDAHRSGEGSVKSGDGVEQRRSRCGEGTWLKRRAPCEPPKTRSRGGQGRGGKGEKLGAHGNARDFGIAEPLCGSGKIDGGRLHATANQPIGETGHGVGFEGQVGTRICRAAAIPGPEAYPPTPKTTFGLKSRTMWRQSRMLRGQGENGAQPHERRDVFQRADVDEAEAESRRREQDGIPCPGGCRRTGFRHRGAQPVREPRRARE